MEITITKNEFEAALPVGTSAHDEVFESVQPAIDRMLRFSKTALLGDEGMAYLESQGTDSGLLTRYKQLVSVSAFLSVLRQLDLVLTPTGFGIVSNDNVSPASKQRVDALEGQLRTQYYRTLGLTLRLLRSKDWGGTSQARYFIDHIYDEYTYFFVTHKINSATDWDTFRHIIEEADEMLRTKMGDAQMDDILDACRCNDSDRLKHYDDIISLIVKFTDAWAIKGTGALRQPVFRRLMRVLDDDDNAECFQLYRSSTSYKANHYEPYTNTRNSAGYIFNG